MDLLEHMPRALLATGPRGLPWLHWLMLPVVAALAGLLGIVLGRLTMWTLRAISRRTVNHWDDRIIEGTAGPLSCLWAILLGFLAAGELGLPAPVLLTINKVLRVGAL